MLVALALALAVGLGTGFVLGSTQQSNTRSSTQTSPAPAIPTTAVPQAAMVVRTAATPACLETARRGDELVALLIQNKRSRVTKLLVLYQVASRQCARDADP
jgi:flagellar basal body-associated protein FliL